MRRIVNNLLLLSAVTGFHVSCSDITVPEGPEGAEGTVVYARADTGADTKVTVREDTDGSRLVITWKDEGESFSVYKDSGVQVPVVFNQVSVDADGRNAEFSADDMILADARYSAVYPSRTGEESPSSLLLDVREQIGTDYESDLDKAYMYACTIGEEGQTSLDFSFRHATSIMKVVLEFPEGMEMTEVSDVRLSAEGGLVTSAKYEISRDGIVRLDNGETKGEIVLKGKDGIFSVTDVEGRKTMTLYVRLLPGKVDNLKVKAKVGEKFYAADILECKEIEAGKWYYTASNRIFEEYNISGCVISEEGPLEGVVVSDGFQTVTTDKDGMYYMMSDKKLGYVFISVPSGHEVSGDGAFPLFYQNVSRSGSGVEYADFELKKVEGQENHIMYVLGDMHLVSRSRPDDLYYFNQFVSDLNRQTAANMGVPQYALTLGDMTWDYFWSKYSFDVYAYKDYSKELFHNLQVFHTMGNHDNDMYEEGDFNAASDYRSSIGPTYYSFNIGSVHYVVLDDILCTNDGTGNRTYESRVSDEQLAWLRADLSYVDESRTVVVASHAPLYYHKKGKFYDNIENKSELLSCLSGFKNLHFFTAHTHETYNVDNLDEPANPHFEHNAGSICASWWWNYISCGLNIGRDGAPGGYTICEFNGSDFEWVYKAYDKEKDFQFRTYDMNNVTKYEGFISPYTTLEDYAENTVMINIWNWDPEWTLSVTENGRELTWTKVYDYDPLHVLGYSIDPPSTNSSFKSKITQHLFLVQAESPDATLEIRVTDRFGNVYKETMARPKAYEVAAYN